MPIIIYNHNIYDLQENNESVIKLKSSVSKTILIVLSAFALLAALGGAVLLFFAMEGDYDAAIKHFDFNSEYANYVLATALGGLALAIAGFFLSSKKLSFARNGRGVTFPVTFVSILAGLMCAIHFWIGVRGGVPEEKPGLLLAELTFTVLSAVYFFLKAFGLTYKKPALALTGLIPALMFAFKLLRLYFDNTDPLNAPLKLYTIVMYVSFMFYFTAEAGVDILRPKMSRKYAFSGIAAVSVGGMVSLSKLAVRVIDVDKFGYDIIEVTFFAVIWLCAVISFAEKLLTSRENKEDEAFLINTEAEDSGETDGSEVAEEAETADEEAKEAVEEAEEAVEEAEEAADEAADEAEQDAEKFEQAAEEAEEAADGAADEAEQDAEEFEQAAEETAEETVEDAADTVEEAVEETVEEAAEKTAEE